MFRTEGSDRTSRVRFRYALVLQMLVTLIVSLILTPSPAAAADGANSPAPVASDECYSCHKERDPARATHASHPFGIDYEAARTRRALRPPTSPSGFGSTVANDFLVNGRVECTSCHYSHEQETSNPVRLRLPDPTGTPAVPGVRAVTTSLCINCHDMSRM